MLDLLKVLFIPYFVNFFQINVTEPDNHLWGGPFDSTAGGAMLFVKKRLFSK